MFAFLLAISLIQPGDGPLPWPIPPLPAVPTVTAPSITLPSPEHSDNYEEQQDSIETFINESSEPVTTINDSLSSWFGEDGSLPDATEGDFTVGLAPIDDVGSFYEFANWLGEQIGELFEYLRAITEMSGTVLNILVIVGLACATILLMIKMFNFALSILDALWSVGNTLLQTIMEIIPL